MLAFASLETMPWTKTNMLQLTVISLRNPVLYTPSFGKISDLCPILIWICVLAEGTTGAETSGPSMGDAFGTTILPVHGSYDWQDERGRASGGTREGRRVFVKMISWIC